MIVLSLQTPDGKTVEFTPDHVGDDQLQVVGNENNPYVTIAFRTAAGVQCGVTVDRKLLVDLETVRETVGWPF